VWSVELDVAWTGDVVDALWSTVNSTDADWVAYGTQRSTRKWFWHTCHNWLRKGEEWKSMRHAARYSRRLLRAIAESMRAGRVQCDELTAPSICAREAGWCAVDASWQPGHPAAGWDPETGEDLYRWDSRISPEQWDRVLAADAAAAAAAAAAANAAAAGGGAGAAGGRLGGRLYHKIKW
jgi:hypothetical protein